MFRTPSIIVSNETELESTINNAIESIVIAFDGNITLTNSPLIIPANKDVTLTSRNNENGFYNLIGANGESAIFVEANGVLRLAGIIVTHVNGEEGRGVHVDLRVFTYR